MEKEQLKVFSERLTKLRQKKELTQQQLGEALQIPRVSITRYETAERTPTVDHLVQFAQFFNVPSDYLLGLSSVESYDIELQAVCDYTCLSEKAICMLKYWNEIHAKEGDNPYFIAQNYIIENEYLNRFCENLFALNFRSVVYTTILENIVKVEREKQYDLYDELYKIGDKCDISRYDLIKLSEKLSNHFDQREQVQDNGKHNPSEE